MNITRIKLNRCLTVLCLIFVLGLAPAVSPVAAAGNKHQLAVLSLAPLVPPRPLCTGETKSYAIIVDATDASGYVSGATVTLNGKTVATTNAGGNATVQYKAEKDGPFTLSIGASKSGYDSGAPWIIKGEAQSCGWRIRMWYEESVHTSGGNFFDATCFMKFDNQSFTRDDNDNLVLTTGNSMIPAKYGCYTGGLEYPLKVTMSPDIGGDIEVQFSGKFVKGSLQITLQALGAALPEMVNLTVEDAVRGGNSGLPPVTWAMQPYADVVNTAGITNWLANPIFDYKIYTAKKSLFFAESGLKLSGGDATVIVERVKSSE